MISGKPVIMLNTTRKLIPLVVAFSFLAILSFVAHAEEGAFASGQADRVFDKVFLQSIRKDSTYGEIVKAVGVPGEIVGINSIKIPGDKFHWKGRENSFFNIRVSAGKLVDANVITSDGHILSFDGTGEVIDYGK